MVRGLLRIREGILPEWADFKARKKGAILHLRLNRERDRINEVLFPFATTATPYARIVSWLVWINSVLNSLIRENKIESVSEYRSISNKLYSILATAEVMHARKESHNGPIGRDRLASVLDEVEAEEFDFANENTFLIKSPESEYRTSIENLELGERKCQEIGGGNVRTFMKLTEKGEELSKEFENNLPYDRESFLNKDVWTKGELEDLSKDICLYGLDVSGDEHEILLNSVKNSTSEKHMIEDWDGFGRDVKQIFEKENEDFEKESVTRAALSNQVKLSEETRKLGLDEESEDTIGLLAFLELHSLLNHSSLSILQALTGFAKDNKESGVRIETVFDRCEDFMEGTDFDFAHKLEDIRLSFENQSEKSDTSFLELHPKLEGKYGLVTLEQNIESAQRKNFPECIGYSSGLILVCTFIYDAFDNQWLDYWLPKHEKYFGNYNFFKIRKTIEMSDFGEWLKECVDEIITHHMKVARSKGLHAFRIRKEGGKLHYYGGLEAVPNRGRYDNASGWLKQLKLF